MSGFSNLKSMVDAESDGFARYSTWRKTASQTTAIGVWFDLSMSPGNPVPQYYASAPLISETLSQSGNGGIFHGHSVSPKKKFLRKLMMVSGIAGPVPLYGILCDYLLFYPFIDESLIDEEQFLTNTAPLPRYEDGAGVMLMAVVVAGHAVGTGTYFTVKYTNQDGTTDRVTAPVRLSTQFVNGTVVSSARSIEGCVGPFLPLQEGDTGVRSVQSVTMSGVADVGLFALVLVKPLAQANLFTTTGPIESDYFQSFSQIPEIKDDAYLNIVCQPSGTLAAIPIHGDATFVWG